MSHRTWTRCSVAAVLQRCVVEVLRRCRVSSAARWRRDVYSSLLQVSRVESPAGNGAVLFSNIPLPEPYFWGGKCLISSSLLQVDGAARSNPQTGHNAHRVRGPDCALGGWHLKALSPRLCRANCGHEPRWVLEMLGGGGGGGFFAIKHASGGRRCGRGGARRAP